MASGQPDLRRRGPQRVGELRPSQLLHTFGVGSVADLPNLSVMVLGLDSWNLEHAERITEDRLLAAVRQRLGPQVNELRTPPYTPETTDPRGPWSGVGVPVALFPGWLRCTDTRCNRLGTADTFTLLPHAYRPDRVRYVHECRGVGGRRPTAVPARFLLACPNGHLDDFPWLYFTHGGETPASDHTLKLQERGTTGEAANIYVTCTCTKSRSIVEAMGRGGEKVLPACRGRHPHLGTFERCTEVPRTMVLGATNAWFASQLRVFSLPRAKDPVRQAVREHWQTLQLVAGVPASVGQQLVRQLAVWPSLERYGMDALWAAITDETERQAEGARTGRSGQATQAADALDLATPEWLALTGEPIELPDFTTAPEPPPEDARPWLAQVVLAKRLREVAALDGFTRISPPVWDPEGGLDERRVPLSAEAPTWLPCAETRGEGIFLRIDENRLAAWESRPDVQARERVLLRAYRAWCLQRGVDAAWPGIRYVLLHSFAHVLIREFALECGYGASGIGERVYARSGASPMAGVLLYTAAPDSEGTLGGLVSLGRAERLGALLEQALDSARLCSSDPLCADHDPSVQARLHGAACHACLFAAETSCERGNRFLDRRLLVPTLAAGDLGFFGDGG
jgi:hypothetical protein